MRYYRFNINRSYMVMFMNILECTGHNSFHTYRKCMKLSLNTTRETKYNQEQAKHHKQARATNTNTNKREEKHIPLRRRRSKPKGSFQSPRWMVRAPTGVGGDKEGRMKVWKEGGGRREKNRRQVNTKVLPL